MAWTQTLDANQVLTARSSQEAEHGQAMITTPNTGCKHTRVEHVNTLQLQHAWTVKRLDSTDNSTVVGSRPAQSHAGGQPSA